MLDGAELDSTTAWLISALAGTDSVTLDGNVVAGGGVGLPPPPPPPQALRSNKADRLNVSEEGEGRNSDSTQLRKKSGS